MKGPYARLDCKVKGGNAIEGTSIVRSHKNGLEGDIVEGNKGDEIHISESSAVSMSKLDV